MAAAGCFDPAHERNRPEWPAGAQAELECLTEQLLLRRADKGAPCHRVGQALGRRCQEAAREEAGVLCRAVQRLRVQQVAAVPHRRPVHIAQYSPGELGRERADEIASTPEG